MDTDHDVFCLRGAFLSRKAKEFFVRDERERVMEATIISRPRCVVVDGRYKVRVYSELFFTRRLPCTRCLCRDASPLAAPLCAPRGRKAARARHLRWLLVVCFLGFLILGILWFF
jgi:hypothetical protein